MTVGDVMMNKGDKYSTTLRTRTVLTYSGVVVIGFRWDIYLEFELLLF